MKFHRRLALLFVLYTFAFPIVSIALSEAEANYTAAVALTKKKKYKQSVPYFDHAIKLAPGVSKIYLGRGDALLLLDEPKRAMEDFNKALKLEPNLKGAFEERARCQFELGDIKAAIDDTSNAIRLEQNVHNQASMLKDRASYYLRLGMRDKALQDLNTAIMIRPKEYYNYSRRADVYASLHQYQRAVDDYSYAIKIHDGRFDDFDSLYSLRARAYDNLGKKDLAEADRKKAVTFSGDIQPP